MTSVLVICILKVSSDLAVAVSDNLTPCPLFVTTKLSCIIFVQPLFTVQLVTQLFSCKKSMKNYKNFNCDRYGMYSVYTVNEDNGLLVLSCLYLCRVGNAKSCKEESPKVSGENQTINNTVFEQM